MADAEFSQNACEGARANAKKHGFTIVYDKAYPPPPKTTDFAPIVRAIKALEPDLVVACAYPLDSIGIVLAANEIGLKPKMFGGAMVGLQATFFKDKLKNKMNGIVNTTKPGCRTKSRCTRAPRSSSPNIRRAPRLRASIRLATISAAGVMPSFRCSAMRSRPPRASRTTRSLPR